MILFFVYLFFICSLLWNYGGYFIFIIILSKIFIRPHEFNECYFPTVTLIIPTYNEEVVIRNKLENIITQDYPKEKLQILVVDSGSNDKTKEIVKEYNKYGIELIEQIEREGKGPAIKYGLNFAKNEIVVITDANSYFYSDTIKHLLKHFSDSKVGGVTGRYFGKNIKENIESRGSMLFRDYENLLRKYETKIDSCVSLFGEIFAVRKELLVIDEKNLTEDFEVSVYIRKKGYKLVYEPMAQVYEYVPSIQKDILIQRRRVIIGTIQTLLKYREMLFNPKYGFYGSLILPGHKLFHILSPIFILGFLSVSLVFWKMSFFIVFCALILAEIFLKAIKSKTSIFGLFKYLVLINISCLLAWKDYLIGNYTVKWEKMESSHIILKE